ncbi:sugar-binding transcriptional regulator [Marinomonas ostreistagni]|uniref:sugar-binding transcriptional regulator n=1 Tax=Marinomonas ostreistagni TaxID=359209 RepID=UPI001951AFBF|nr:sugar-binding transcriptional regulator [Marinomonas ostreistagni]MBM6550358.1 sugar-binding transcriptional regulator [Marinomonas ostreistagni]
MNTNYNELRLLIKIATLYYSDGLKQADIAKLLNLSQSQVSRAISRCLKEGLVKISVVQPQNIFVDLEKQLQTKYGFTQAVIVDVPEEASNEQIRVAIGAAAAHYMQSTLQKDDLIGVSSWSETIRAMVDSMHPQTTKASGVVQILGGVGQNGNLQANMLTHSLARMLGSEAFLLPASGVDRSIEEKSRMMSSPEVAEVVAMFDDITVAVIGIGSMEPSTLLRNSGNYYNEEKASELLDRGAVGDICLHYYDQAGQPVLQETEDPVISMTLKQLRACPRVVALAGGSDKVEALRGGLLGGYIDVLITDRITAQKLV